MTELSPKYNPTEFEEPLYQRWESQGLFNADPDGTRTPYTIVIPPPNVTGILHMGHALNNTIQDILIRYKRMHGFNALWIPGTDHAGIATQNVVEKALAKEGKKRQDLGRDAFVKRVWEWKEQSGHTIIRQLRRLGASCDWRRTRFTMDEGLSEAVLEMFIRLYKDGLIYRGNYIINWCPRCQTALSDEEAPRQATAGKLYHIRYPLAEPRKHGAPYLEVATTRPETMLGDTAIAVHPKDKRYKTLIGSHALLPIVGRRLPIIADDMVDREFGTGAVKVTPAHDPVDFALGRKHKLEFLNVMTPDAHMTNVPAAYEGLDRFECRSKLVVDLEKAGVLGPIDEHPHNVGHCYRCHTAIEPRLSPQWFVKMKPLAIPAIKAVKHGTISFAPKRWTKVYLNWMENIQDWCISRQIWWGHRLPVYYCQNCTRPEAVRSPRSVVRSKKTKSTDYGPSTMDQGVIVSKTPPKKCPSCGGTDIKQDEDVLDTWFSSWLWPFSTLGWPKATKDLKCFYPTDVLVTAQEIIFFWVARMIMAGYYTQGKPPFSQVYIHGTVRDITGKKMSKSLGNIIDPLDIIAQYGTDALRYTLVTATAIGQDVFLSEERFAAGRNFANKLWNATRFVLSQGGIPQSAFRIPQSLSVPDRWILSRLQRTIEKVTDALDGMLFNEAASTVYDFLWHDFCDWYLEASKAAPADQRAQTHAVLGYTLETSLRLLHPVMPYVTEILWQHLQGRDPAAVSPETSIMRAAWPRQDRKRLDAKAEALFEQLQAVISAVRVTRAELNVPLESRPAVHVLSPHSGVREFFTAHRGLVQALAQIGELVVAADGRPANAAATVVGTLEVFIPLEGLIDPAKERARLTQRVDHLHQEQARIERQLANTEFTAKAPAEVVEQVKTRQREVQDTLQRFAKHLAVVQAL